MFCAIVGTIVAAAIGALVMAVFLRAASSWLARVEIEYGDAFKVAFWSSLAGAAVNLLVTYATGQKTSPPLAQVLGQVTALLCLTAMLRTSLDVGWGRALLTALFAVALAFVTVLIVVFGFVFVATVLKGSAV